MAGPTPGSIPFWNSRLKLESGDAADVVDGSIASPPCATDTSDPMAARTLPATGMPTICCLVLGSE